MGDSGAERQAAGGARLRSDVVTLAACGVLVDLDGTLVDTEPLWFDVYAAFVAAHGGRWTHADAARLVGSDLVAAARVLIGAAPGAAGTDPQELARRNATAVCALARDRLDFRPGALDFLAGVRAAGLPAALVTMSYRALADAVVAQLPAGTFGAVVTGDEVTHGKPHPEPYLRAAQLLGLPAEQCLAIEDSPTGLASAEAAGCRVVGVPNVAPVPPAPGRVVVPSLALLRVVRGGGPGGPPCAEHA